MYNNAYKQFDIIKKISYKIILPQLILIIEEENVDDIDNYYLIIQITEKK